MISVATKSSFREQKRTLIRQQPWIIAKRVPVLNVSVSATNRNQMSKSRELQDKKSRLTRFLANAFLGSNLTNAVPNSGTQFPVFYHSVVGAGDQIAQG